MLAGNGPSLGKGRQAAVGSLMLCATGSILKKHGAYIVKTPDILGNNLASSHTLLSTEGDTCNQTSPHPFAFKVIAIQNLERVVKINPAQKRLTD